MSVSDNPQSDSFLLVLDEAEFISVGALLGLRARPTSAPDATLVDSWLEGETTFTTRSENLLITAMPGIPDQ